MADPKEQSDAATQEAASLEKLSVSEKPAIVEVEVSEGHAQWLAAFWFGAAGGPGSRKHAEVHGTLEGRSCVRLQTSALADDDTQADFAARWSKQLATVLKKLEVEDLGDMDAPSLREVIPEEDSGGRGMRDLVRLEQELQVKVVFLDNPDEPKVHKHVLLVGAKAKLAKKCLVIRNLLSHYHWRLSGRDVSFESMVAK